MKNLLIFAFSLSGLVVFAQKTHTVQPKENPYAISKKYGISIDELYKLNPQVKEGKLNIGDVLVISKKNDEKPKTTEKPVSSGSGNLSKIVLQPKQTIYGITKQYHISETDLRKLNPELDSHLRIGDEVTLPSDNVKKYADKNAFNRNFAAPQEVKPAESVAVSTSVETPKADEGTYVIQAKDNYYKITKNFGISQKDLFALNPGLEEKGLQPGDVIKVKKSGNVSDSNVKDTVSWQEDNKNTKQEVQVQEDEYQTYTVQDGDTVFGILNKFGITLDQLIAFNPKITDGLKTGMVIKVKKLEPAYVKKNDGALNVILMLPFGFDAGESKYRSMAADFLTGAKLAIERSAAGGQKLDVKVVDAGSESSFKNSLTQINPNNTDLIIGPFFKSSVLDVLDYVKTKKIPVVAPFANSPELESFNNLVIVETDQEVLADKIAKEVAQAYSDEKIYVVADQDKTYANYIKDNLAKQIKNPNIIIVNSPDEIKLDNNMMTGQSAPIMAVLASDNDSVGKDFAKKMMDLSAETSGVKSFSMYYNPIFESNEEALRKASLVYLMDRKINTDGSFEKEILASYKKQYCKTPSKYAVIGFDVVNDILSRENSKGELFKQITKSQTQLATKFEYVKSKGGAYVNTGCRVVRLIP
ncbi:LysM peptidoglycan-binding domain-containing protein [Cloacibacterium sp.]|uniref:LysM peptidoglycan-binding domain-containing protein n=1 Tax=Cloacibacterium sp. TaxID=1913682 RepID=UPI0039E3C7D4